MTQITFKGKGSVKGFTLLELLIVITIIGIIAAIILLALGSSKKSGKDAGVESNLVNARSQAELYQSIYNTYEGVCNDLDEGIIRHLQEAKRSFGGSAKVNYTDNIASTWNTEECHDSTTSYVAWVPLSVSESGSPVGLCIDASKDLREVSQVIADDEMECP